MPDVPDFLHNKEKKPFLKHLLRNALEVSDQYVTALDKNPLLPQGSRLLSCFNTEEFEFGIGVTWHIAAKGNDVTGSFV